VALLVGLTADLAGHAQGRRTGLLPGPMESGHNGIMETSTVIAVDVSLRLPMRGLWDACRRSAAMAADSIRTRQGLAPLVVGFNDYAKRIDVSDLADLECDAVYGTNVQHALSMARYALDEGRGARRILFVAETEPSSYCDVDGEAYFYFPPTPEVKRITLNEARACALAGIRVDFLLLTTDSPFRPLAAEIAEGCGGCVQSISGPMPTANEIEEFLDDIGLS
jgi:uncharacterized protein with von Willebrand factor type A (vWA) domain